MSTSFQLRFQVSVALICTLPSVALAQEETDRAAAAQRTVEQSNIVANGGPADREASGFGGGSEVSGPNFELSNKDHQIVGTFTVGYSTAKSSFENNPGGGQIVKASLLRYGLKASVPFNGTNKTDVLDFRNIGDDAKATFSVTWHSTSFKEGGARTKAVNLSLRQCVSDAVEPHLKSLPGAERASAQADAESLLEQYDRDLGVAPKGTLGRGILERYKKDKLFPNFIAAGLAACGGDIGEEFLLSTYGRRALGVDAYRAIARDYINDGDLWFLGGESTIGYQKHDILDRTAFVIDLVERVGFEITAYGGVIAGNGNWSGRISGGYSRGYKANDEAQFCMPALGGVGQQCLKAEDGKPVRNVTSFVKAEGRMTLLRSASGIQRLAIAPEVNYDIGERNFIIDVPLFFQRTDGEGLSGGLRAGYNTDKKDFALRLFVGVPFSTWF